MGLSRLRFREEVEEEDVEAADDDDEEEDVEAADDDDEEEDVEDSEDEDTDELDDDANEAIWVAARLSSSIWARFISSASCLAVRRRTSQA
jgi:hypothetical protein